MLSYSIYSQYFLNCVFCVGILQSINKGTQERLYIGDDKHGLFYMALCNPPFAYVVLHMLYTDFNEFSYYRAWL